MGSLSSVESLLDTVVVLVLRFLEGAVCLGAFFLGVVAIFLEATDFLR